MSIDIIRCSLCTETFLTPKAVQEHQILVHQLSREYICALCGKEYRSTGGLSVHMEVEHAPTDGPSECDVCHRMFKTQPRLRAHKRKQHSGEVTCELCGKIFKNKVRLREISDLCFVAGLVYRNFS